MQKIKLLLIDFIVDADGQAITEYGAVLAFVALLVALLGPVAFSSPNKGLCYQIWVSFGKIAAWLQLMANTPH